MPQAILKTEEVSKLIKELKKKFWGINYSFPICPKGVWGKDSPKNKNILQAEQYINSIASRQGNMYASNTKVLIIAY